MEGYIKYPSLNTLWIFLQGLNCLRLCWCTEFRLAGGMRPNEGYLEVKRNIRWLGARSERWSVENSRVVCRMLGFSEAVVNVSGNASFVQPNASFTELQARCRGNETRVQKCVGWKLTGGGTTYPIFPIWLLCQTNVHLEGNKEGHYGVGVDITPGWKPLCGYSWGMNAKVVCRQLGYPGVLQVSTLPRKPREVCNQAFNCSGNEDYISECPKMVTKNGSFHDAMVKCMPDCRLFNKTLRYKGRVEIYHEGKWGALYDSTWTKSTADLLCKGLGYSSAASFKIQASSMLNETWRMAISCNGTETNLRQCNGWKNVMGRSNVSEEIHVECQYRVFIRKRDKGGRRNKGGVKLEQYGSNVTLCLNNRTNENTTAKVLCQQAGFPAAFGIVKRSFYYCSIVVQCSGNEQSLEDCAIIPLQSRAYMKKAAVKCERRIRLMEAGQIKKKGGRLEIYRNHEWGDICDENWTGNDANVSCRELGYDMALDWDIARNSIEPKKVLMKNVICKGDENILENCKYETGTSTSDCAKQGVSVQCVREAKDLCSVCKPCSNSSVDCSSKNLSFIPWIPDSFDEYGVTSLNLKDNKLVKIKKLYLDYPSLTGLDMSTNKIKVIHGQTFENNVNLSELNLSNNKIEDIPEQTFQNNKKIEKLDISDNNLNNNWSFLKPLKNLKYLNLSNNKIEDIPEHTFQNNKKLEKLDMSENNLDTDWSFLKPLQNLKYLKTSRYIPDCCYALQIHPMLTCDAVRVMSAFSSCKDLLKDKALAVVVWIIITLSVAGNLSSIFIGATLRERDRTQRLLITNLGVSDLLNGVYLLIIAINDRRWAGQYFNKDIEWRSSFLCNLTGFISMLSIQVSVFTLTAISTIRCIATLSPLSFRGLTVTTTVATLAATWCVGIFLSVAPFLNDSYFNENSVGFFGGNSVCLPLQLPGERLNGWEYGLAIFGFLNILLCLYLATAYVVLFYSLRRKPECAASAKIANEQSALVKRLFVVVLTNLCCLFPVGLLMYLSLAGRIVNPQRAVYAWFAVCVMSLNSAFNPLLYTFTTPKLMKILKQTAVKIYGFCRTESNTQDFELDEKNTAYYIAKGIAAKPECTVRMHNVNYGSSTD